MFVKVENLVLQEFNQTRFQIFLLFQFHVIQKSYKKYNMQFNQLYITKWILQTFAQLKFQK